MEVRGLCEAFFAMRARRLEDRIRGLCAQVAMAEPPELSPLLVKLQSALREHTERLRAKTLERLVSGEFKERRHSPPLQI
jgi:hypothetical protein